MENEDIEFIADEEVALDIEKVKKLKERLKQCEAERKEYLDGWQRAKADHINYKKEEGKRAEELAYFVVGGFLQEVLPVLDSFAALENHFKGEPRSPRLRENEAGPSEDGRDPAQGTLRIYSQLMDILKKRGLEEIAVKMGEEFNPEKHESVGETESEVKTGTIAEIIQKGYTLGGRVMRPVRVKIARGVEADLRG